MWRYITKIDVKMLCQLQNVGEEIFYVILLQLQLCDSNNGDLWGNIYIACYVLITVSGNPAIPGGRPFSWMSMSHDPRSSRAWGRYNSRPVIRNYYICYIYIWLQGIGNFVFYCSFYWYHHAVIILLHLVPHFNYSFFEHFWSSFR